MLKPACQYSCSVQIANLKSDITVSKLHTSLSKVMRLAVLICHIIELLEEI
jgi:hypothetical protein